MNSANEEKKIYLCRTIESEQFKTKIYDSGSIGFSNAFLKCKLSREEHNQILMNREEFVEKTLYSWRGSFHRMLIQNIYLYDNEFLGYLIITIANESQIDKIDAQRIRKWGEDFLIILTEYQIRALENARTYQSSAGTDEIYLAEQQSGYSDFQKFPQGTIAAVDNDSASFEAEEEPEGEEESVDASVFASVNRHDEYLEGQKPAGSEAEAAEVYGSEASQQIESAETAVSETPEFHASPIEPASAAEEPSDNLIPKIQDELSQLLLELGDLKASITEVKSQTEAIPINGISGPADTSYTFQEKERTDYTEVHEAPSEFAGETGNSGYAQPKNLHPQDYSYGASTAEKENYRHSEEVQDALPYQPSDDVLDSPEIINDQKQGTLKIERVLEEVNNLSRFNDEWKSYQFKNKRQINKISSKVLSAHLKNSNTRVNYRDLYAKMKNIEFISYLWGQVKMIRKEKNPIYFDDCDLETLVEDAIDFYQSEVTRYLNVKKPKLSRKMQVPDRFSMLVDAYNDLEYYLETLLKENVENPVVLNRIATK